jgi:prepilin-type N-terminal cleavage/methylation domain
MSKRYPQHGFTLIELVVAMAVFGILVMIAVPSFTSMMDSIRVKRAADAISAFMANAKSEAIKRNRTVTVVFQTSNSHATWCAGMAAISDCDCTGADTTKLCRLDDNVDRVLTGDASYRNILLTDSTGNTADNTDFSFSPNRGNVDAGSVQVQSKNGLKVRVVVSTTGRVRLCSPSGSGNIGGYAVCS